MSTPNYFLPHRPSGLIFYGSGPQAGEFHVYVARLPNLANPLARER